MHHRGGRPRVQHDNIGLPAALQRAEALLETEGASIAPR